MENPRYVCVFVLQLLQIVLLTPWQLLLLELIEFMAWALSSIVHCSIAQRKILSKINYCEHWTH